MNYEAIFEVSEGVRIRLPWRLFMFLLAVLAVSSLDPMESSDYVTRRDKSVETRLEESIERTEEGNPTRRLALTALGVFGVATLMKRDSVKLQVQGALGVTMLFFLLWAFASTLWSYDTALTIRRVAILGMLCMGAVATAKLLTFREIAYFAFIAGCVTILGGLACELALGAFDPRNPEYRFAGMMNPIFQGAHCGMTIIAAMALAQDSSRVRFFYIAAALVSAVLLLLTHSRGPVAATLVAVAVYSYLSWLHLRKFAVIMALVVGVPCLFPSVRAELPGLAEDLFLSGRKIETGYEMQGRDALWQECLAYAAKNPYFGYGYDAFWTRELTYAVTDASGFTSQHTHNAFLDLLLGIGIPGAAAYYLAIVLAGKKLVRLHRESQSIYHAAALALLVLYVIHNVFVSVHLAVQFQTFIMLVILAKLGLVQDNCPEENSELRTANA